MQTVSLDQRYDLFEAQNCLTSGAWPEFMLHDPVPGACWTKLMEAFSNCQLMILDDDEILAVINSVPLHFDQDLALLPDRGVDWGVQKALNDLEANLQPNYLMAVQIVVAAVHQSKGLSTTSVQELGRLAAKLGIEKIIVPLRPANKHRFPLIPFEEYMNWKNQDGLPYDGWLRVHVKLGAEIIRICPESMYIPGSVVQWQDWTGMTFPGSGSYVIPGALNPVTIDLKKDLGEYTEPNVWLLHDLNRPLQRQP